MKERIYGTKCSECKDKPCEKLIYEIRSGDCMIEAAIKDAASEFRKKNEERDPEFSVVDDEKETAYKVGRDDTFSDWNKTSFERTTRNGVNIKTDIIVFFMDAGNTAYLNRERLNGGMEAVVNVHGCDEDEIVEMIDEKLGRYRMTEDQIPTIPVKKPKDADKQDDCR